MTPTTAPLNAFYSPGFEASGRQRFQVGSAPPGMERAPRCVRIADARAAQAEAGVSEADFLGRHGFVLLPHPTEVKDWDSEVAGVYLPEIDRLVRERLLPGRRVEIGTAPLLRRGRGTAVPFYADGVHSDGGLGLDDHLHNIGAFAGDEAAGRWRERYERDDVEGLIWLNFWRPTNMAGPLEHMPLAICDPASLDEHDLVPTGMTGLAPEARETRHLSLRFNAGQRWFYYPRMGCDEVIAFKLAEFWKIPSPMRNVFHTAFQHPATHSDAEERQSCELRVSVLLLKD
jgi:hypothetical protein